MISYVIKKIHITVGKAYIKEHHYSKTCSYMPGPCYGLFDGENLIGVLLFANLSTDVAKASIFGMEYKNHVTELHRLHIQDDTPKNTESWFVSRCLKLLKKEKPDIWGVVSYSDPSAGHSGIIYRATNAYYLGVTEKKKAYIDEQGRLRHQIYNGKSFNSKMAKEAGWTIVQREGKHKYLWLLPDSKKHKKKLIQLCRYDLTKQKFS